MLNTRVGVAGLGIMGSAMAARLLGAGYPVSVYNRTAERSARLVAMGAQAVSTASKLSEACDVILIVVSDETALLDVLTGSEGILESASSSLTIVNLSTVSPAATARVMHECEVRKLGFIDCPVSGSKPQAESGELVLLAAGDEAKIQTLAPLLSVIGKRIIYAGAAGRGTALKLAVNLMLAHLAASLAEGVRFCEAVDIDPALLIEALSSAPALNAGYFQGKGKKTLANDWSPQFPLKHMLKDVRLALDQAQEQLPIAHAIEELFAKAASEGHAEEDICSVIGAIEPRSR
jgi:3-hydroxyisobutyrate dehydrogenase-like beta-hydroxyacid dehydrogenase